MKAPLIAAAVLLIGALQFAAAAPEHDGVISSGDSVKWGAPPPVFSAGAKFAVIEGDPAAEGLVTVRLMMPPGYAIAPHWHPTDEHVTVLKGTLLMGMGDTLDKSHPMKLTSGGYAVARAKMHHYAWTESGATIQVHMKGPFAITYVNPADDPSKAAH
jgi:mannose-6-phosphate isomerase-like protein (cupin superfamily)